MRKFIREYAPRSPIKKNTKSTNSETIRYDDDWKDFENLSKMFHLNYSHLERTYNLCTIEKATNPLWHEIRKATFTNVRNSARILGVILTHLRNITTSDFGSLNRLIIQFNKLDEQLSNMRKEMIELENNNELWV